jgi:TolB-like protein/Tfp pilus assembly protein PilF
LALGLRATASDLALHLAPSVRRPSRLIVGFVAASLLIGAIGAAAYFLTRHGNRPESGPQGGVAKIPAEEAKTVEALAVLPFENIGGDPQTEHLCDGIPESIIKSLYEVRSLKVRPFSSVSRYKGRGKDIDLQEVGRQLNVQAVLTGKLRQGKESLALSVELVDVRDLSGIWIGRYDRKRVDILPVQEEIVKQICAELGVRLSGEEKKRRDKRYTENAEAFELYLKGRYFQSSRTEESLKKSIAYFEQAIAKDRKYALAYAGLADSYTLLGNFGIRPPNEVSPKAKAKAEKALDLDDTLAEAHTALAFIRLDYDWNGTGARSELERAIELNPRYGRAHSLYACYFTARGRFDEGLAEIKGAVELDPLSLYLNSNLGWHLHMARRYDQAIEQFRTTLDLDPNYATAHEWLGLVYEQKRMYAEAIAEFQRAITLSGGRTAARAGLGHTYAVAGKRSEAQNIINQLKEQANHKYVSSYEIAMIFTGLGEKEQAIEWLKKAYEERDGWLALWLPVDPRFDALRSDPQFTDLLQRMGVADKAAVREQGIHSVAVLPFENVGGDPKTEFLSDGVADQIINSLSQVRRKDLKVRPFTSVSRYKRQRPDVLTIGRELNVDVLVTGTLHEQGDDLSISVALVDAREDTHLWGPARPYQGKKSQILDLQDQIARDVAANLKLRLTGEEDKRLTKRYTEDSEAYLLYREGVYHMNKFTEEGLATAVEYFQRALKKDPKYALALVGLARSNILLGVLHRGPRQTLPEARKYLTQALEIDPGVPGVQAGLGTIFLFHDWDWPAAERALKESGGDLDPSLPTRAVYGFYLAAMGRPADALPVIRQAHELNPLAAAHINELAMCYNWMRQYDQAIAEARKAIELDPNFFPAYGELGRAYAEKGMHSQAIAELQKGLNQGKGHPRIRGLLGYAYAAAGQNAEARKELEELKGPNRRYGCAFAITRIHAALGEKDQAFEWLRKACDERDSNVIWLKVDRTLDNLRSDPRFTQILKDMGLPP